MQPGRAPSTATRAGAIADAVSGGLHERAPSAAEALEHSPTGGNGPFLSGVRWDVSPDPASSSALAQRLGVTIERHPYNVISVRHLERLVGGALLATSPRIDWARLLRRTYGFDPLLCPHCGHRLRPLAEITEPDVVSKFLDAVGYERRSVPRARAPALERRTTRGRVAGPPHPTTIHPRPDSGP